MKNEQDKISFDDKIINWISKHIVLVFFVFIIIVIVVPNLFARLSIYPFIKSDGDGLAPNEIGDAIGGMTAPIIGLFSAFLVYVAFRTQIQANENLENFNKRDSKIKELDNIFKLSDRLKSQVNELKLIIDKKKPMENITGIESIRKSTSKLFNKEIIFDNSNLFNHINDCIDIYEYLYLYTNEIIDSNLDEKYKKYFLNELNDFTSFIDVTVKLNENITSNNLSNINFENETNKILYELSYNKLIAKMNRLKFRISNSDIK